MYGFRTVTLGRLAVAILLAILATAWILSTGHRFRQRDEGSNVEFVDASAQSAGEAAGPEPRQKPSAPLIHASEDLTEPTEVARIPRSQGTEFDRFVSQVEELRLRAKEGDLVAMKELYRGFQRCRGVPRTQTGVEELAKLGAGVGSEGESDVQTARSFLARTSALCARMGPNLAQEQYLWLRAAAGLGDIEARLDFVRLGAPQDASVSGYADRLSEYRRLGAQILDEEISNGNLEALGVASMSFGPDRLFRPDDVKEYAYLYAYSLSSSRTDEALFRRLASLHDRLDSVSLANATKQGEAMYFNCCRRK